LEVQDSGKRSTKQAQLLGKEGNCMKVSGAMKELKKKILVALNTRHTNQDPAVFFDYLDRLSKKHPKNYGDAYTKAMKEFTEKQILAGTEGFVGVATTTTEDVGTSLE
jgi:hypothetical protein